MRRDFLNFSDRVREGEILLIKGVLHYVLSSEGCLVKGRLQPDLAEFSYIFTSMQGLDVGVYKFEELQLSPSCPL